jgi:uncharacterized protein (TIGR03437 family)
MTTPGAWQPSFERGICGTMYMGHVPVPVYCEHAFVARIDASGARVLALTYVTGTGSDTVNGVAAAADGSIWLAGSTRQPSGADAAGFLAHISADATQLLTRQALPFRPSGLVPAGDLVYVAGTADGDAVIAAYDGSGGQVWMRTVGGSADDAATAIASDAAGGLYIVGYTTSIESDPTVSVLFPSTPNSYHTRGGSSDVFVLKLRAGDGGIVYSSVFGGAGTDSPQTVAVDSQGSALLTGSSLDPSTFPAVGPPFGHSPNGQFVAKLSPDGTRLLFSTLLGSGAGDQIDRTRVDAQDRLTISGWTTDFTFPTTQDAQDPCYPDSDPARFFTILNSPGDHVDYSTFLHQRVLAVHPTGRLYLQGVNQIIDLFDPFAPVPAGPRCLVSAASFRGHNIAPGEVISVFGTELGPETPVPGLGSSLGGTRLLVGGLAAPLLYVSAGQINAVVPFALQAGEAVTVEVERDGTRKPSVIDTTVVATQPSIFAASGWAATINQAGTVNSADNPAPVGSVVSLWATGFGALTPQRADGAVPEQAESMVAAPVRIYVEGQPAEVLYAGDAPGLVAGVVQVNFRVPATPDTGFVRVIAYVGDAYTDYRVSTSIWVRSVN